MKILIKLSFFIIIIGVFALFPVAFGYSSLIKEINTNGLILYTFDFSKYLSNISNYFLSFKNNIAKVYEVPLSWNNVIDSLKSICNILIAVLNSILLPFAIVIQLLPLIFSLCGWIISPDNFIVQVFAGLNSLQIPYISL